MKLLLAAASGPTIRPWPDHVDWALISLFIVMAFGLPLVGHWLMIADFRRYLRSLRRALTVIAQVARPNSPYWLWRELPPCLHALELDLSCTEEQVLAAYRVRVKALHPDRGGDLRQFLQLQRHFEQALHLARTREQVRTAAGE